MRVRTHGDILNYIRLIFTLYIYLMACTTLIPSFSINLYILSVNTELHTVVCCSAMHSTDGTYVFYIYTIKICVSTHFSCQLSNLLTLKICDTAHFPVANNQIWIRSQIKILTSCKHQQYDFNFIKIQIHLILISLKLEVFEFTPRRVFPLKPLNCSGKWILCSSLSFS